MGLMDKVTRKNSGQPTRGLLKRAQELLRSEKTKPVPVQPKKKR